MMQVTDSRLCTPRAIHYSHWFTRSLSGLCQNCLPVDRSSQLRWDLDLILSTQYNMLLTHYLVTLPFFPLQRLTV